VASDVIETLRSKPTREYISKITLNSALEELRREIVHIPEVAGSSYPFAV